MNNFDREWEEQNRKIQEAHRAMDKRFAEFDREWNEANNEIINNREVNNNNSWAQREHDRIVHENFLSIVMRNHHM